ncbi:hypothetical protein GGI12_005139 [Dipsacomyces acuminosporus]|nr:hypothetical protein GGI12_005139 [Dipsacomyces acuminosporus]
MLLKNSILLIALASLAAVSAAPVPAPRKIPSFGSKPKPAAPPKPIAAPPKPIVAPPKPAAPAKPAAPPTNNRPSIGSILDKGTQIATIGGFIHDVVNTAMQAQQPNQVPPEQAPAKRGLMSSSKPKPAAPPKPIAAPPKPAAPAKPAAPPTHNRPSIGSILDKGTQIATIGGFINDVVNTAMQAQQPNQVPPEQAPAKRGLLSSSKPKPMPRPVPNPAAPPTHNRPSIGSILDKGTQIVTIGGFVNDVVNSISQKAQDGQVQAQAQAQA